LLSCALGPIGFVTFFWFSYFRTRLSYSSLGGPSSVFYWLCKCEYSYWLHITQFLAVDPCLLYPAWPSFLNPWKLAPIPHLFLILQPLFSEASISMGWSPAPCSSQQWAFVTLKPCLLISYFHYKYYKYPSSL
jgi:hypothetical protein